MESSFNCKKCGEPLESESSICLACVNRSNPRVRPGTAKGRMSLARLYSSTERKSISFEPKGEEGTGEQSDLLKDSGPTSDSSVAHRHTKLPGPTDGDDFLDEEMSQTPASSTEDESSSEISDELSEDLNGELSRTERLDTILLGMASDERKEDAGGLGKEGSDAIPAVPVRRERLRIGEPTPKVRTFIEGFDEALGGGIPEGSIVLISGSAGAMKSTLAYYILYTNVLSRGAKCLYITLEQTLSSLLRQMSEMGMDPIATGGSLRMFDMGFIRKHIGKSKKSWFKLFLKNIDNMRSQEAFEIMVIDSLEALEVLANFKNRRADLFRLFEWLRDMEITAFIITERSDCPFGKHLSHLRNEEEFLADGIINLALHSINEIDVQRRIRCFKMRGTKHEPGYLSLMWDDGKFKVTKAVGR